MRYTEVLSIDGFYVVNKKLIQILESSDASLILSYLCYRANLWEEQGGNTDGWFYCTYEFIEKDLCIKRRGQQTSVKILKSKGLVETTNKGVPAKRHFRIGDLSILFAEHTTSYETYKLKSTKRTSNNVQNVQQYNKDTIINYNNNIYVFDDFYELIWKTYKTINSSGKAEGKEKAKKLSEENLIKLYESVLSYKDYSQFEGYKHCLIATFINKKRYLDDWEKQKSEDIWDGYLTGSSDD